MLWAVSGFTLWRFAGTFGCVAGCVFSVAVDASAEARARAPAGARQKVTKAKGKPKAAPAEVHKSAPEAPAPDTDQTDAESRESEKEKAESAPRAAATGKTATPVAATVQANKEGIKTYKFGAIEVEGRLKSPQIIYFLRRVRAEFDAGLLGHRSFMRELSDTRNHPALR
jgi:hypothetical protein